MNCIAIMESGNFALALTRLLNDGGIQAQVVSTPCRLSGEGCGYSVKFDENDKDGIFRIANEKNIKINSVYWITKEHARQKYHKLL